MPKREIELRAPQALMSPTDQFEFDWRMGKALAASGMFKDAKQAEQAFAKIVVGRELGLSPAQSMTGLHLVEGNVQAHYATLGLFVRSNGYDYRIVEHTNERCSIEFGPPPAPGKDAEGAWVPWPEAVGVSSFSMQDAVTAGLIRGARMFEKFPRNMLFARAMSNGVKWYCPEVLAGVPIYFDGEIESSRMVDGAPASEAQSPDTVSLTAVVEDIPAGLRDRFYAAYGDASHLRPGEVNPAAVGMSVRGQSFERVAEFIGHIERENDVARAERESKGEEEVTDAEVVPATDEEEVQILETRLAELRRQFDEVQQSPGDQDETEEELDRLGIEIDEVESDLAVAVEESQGRLL